MAVSRFQAEQGQTVRLRVRFERNGNLFDPDSIERVEIHQRTGPMTTVLVATIAGASVVQEAQGIFYVDWFIPEDQAVGAYVDRWYFIADPGGTEQFDDATFAILGQGTISASAGYITTEEVRDRYLPDTALSDADLAVLIDEATEWFEYGTGRFFGSRAMTLELDGTGECWIVAPYHVQSISSITVRDSCCPATSEDIDVDDFVLKGRWIVHKGYLPWPHGGARDSHLICGCGCCDVFTRGQKNVTIEGMFGLYEDVPALVKKAVGLMVMYGGEDDTRVTPMGYNYDSESSPSLPGGTTSYARRATDTLAAVKLRGFTGIPEVDAIMNLFRKVACRMSVV